MEDEREKPDATPAPQLSAEFLSGGTAAGLEKIRARLLNGEEVQDGIWSASRSRKRRLEPPLAMESSPVLAEVVKRSGGRIVVRSRPVKPVRL